MRDYAKIAPQFWTGKTGKALKKRGSDALIVAMYLMTSPHANMIGVYHCPIGYIVIDTGLDFEGASKGLASAIEVGFCTYDEASDYVFVHEFATYQIGEELDANDNRCKGIRNELSKLPRKYKLAFHIPDDVILASVKEAPPKPLRSQEQEKEQEQEKKQDQDVSAAPASPPAAPAPPVPPAAPAAATPRGSRLPDDWKLPKPWGEAALAEYPQWTPAKVRLEGEKFRDHWVSKTGKDATKLDWQATWRNWYRDPIAHRDDPKPARGIVTDASLAAANAASTEEARRRLFGNTDTEIIDA